MEPNPIRVLLADDHALVRAGIRALLEKTGRVEVVAEAGDGPHAFKLIEQLSPHVVLIDLTMRGLNGFEVLKEAVERFPAVRFVVLTVYGDEDYALRALQAGAAGYLSKSAATAELELAIAHVMTGKKYLSPSIEQQSTRSRSETSPGRVVADLTPRQREVLTLIADGRSTKDIARALSISVKTVETHRSQLMDRLNIHDIASLVRYALKVGLVSLEERGPLKKKGGGTNLIFSLGSVFFLGSALRFFLD